ncbi:single-stranded-DNA-specific exonuclease RecJ [Fonticella tunisiensis]|uniref:Single-stranded-DNA-specific exonuclease RecJ n=1 Tax=Fonticella tunisiensis TaxID=1096341 RepID=A0A4R7K4P7_9CLOT|nr:DHH family phosphoesterase [Fonticella tunisiensis]TDT45970.1 single-stranded-DNA-specific exonuclease RecJ [Fonticella tunisiensis]
MKRWQYKTKDYLFAHEKFHDPFLLKDMDRAVTRIDAAIRGGEKIVIFGGYDVGGIASISILYRAFRKLGVDVGYYIPDRIDGGCKINKESIDYMKTLAADLIITVHTGVRSTQEIKYARSLGMDIIIADCHELSEDISDALVINPKRHDCLYPCKFLSGSGVAFKLIQALWMYYGLKDFEDFLDIAAIGTIADDRDVKGENRTIVDYGIEKINKSENHGIKALKLVSGMHNKATRNQIAFKMIPRIDAAGRFIDARIAVELFITYDYDKALQIAKYLDQENKKREYFKKRMLKEDFISV